MEYVDEFIEARNYTKSYGRKVDVWVVHDDEYPERVDSSTQMARYFAGPNAPRASAHACVDVDTTTGCVPWKDVAWHVVGGGMNTRSIGIEHSGYAHQSRAEWLDEYGIAMLKRSARLFVDVGMGIYGIPPVKLSVAQIAAGERGICGHGDVTIAYNVAGGHSDPGGQFPWDFYLDEINKLIAPQEDDDMAAPSFIQRTSDGTAWQIRPYAGTRKSLRTLDGITGDNKVAQLKYMGTEEKPQTTPAADWLITDLKEI